MPQPSLRGSAHLHRDTLPLVNRTGAPAQRDASIHILSGGEALALLADASFVSQWTETERATPWATPTQRPDFSAAWYRCYADVATPVLVFRGEPRRDLRALLALAAFPGNRLTVAGAEQSEYQGWIAHPDETEFITAALDALALRYPAHRLRFQYLAPGIPTDVLDAHPRWGALAVARSETRGLMRLDPAETARTLKKSGNRSKLNRLKQLGEVRLDRLTERQELAAVIDEIAAHCDLRQCAMNGVMPFRDDTRKREFYLSMLEAPGLLHATVLRVGSTVAAAHLGVASARDVSLGVIAHNPFLAAHSPGKLLIHLLSNRLAEEGFQLLDLTPGGAYKDRFASEYDEVQVRDIHFGRASFVATSVARRSRALAKRVVLAVGRLAGLDEAAVRRRAAALRGRGSTSEHAGGPAGGAPMRGLLRIDAHAAQRLPVSGTVARDRAEDLQRYDAIDPPRQQFCRDVLQRLEAGEHAYTLSDTSGLLHCAWLRPPVDEGGGATPRAALLTSGYTRVGRSDGRLELQSLLQRAQDAVLIDAAEFVDVDVDGLRSDVLSELARLGFTRLGP